MDFARAVPWNSPELCQTWMSGYICSVSVESLHLGLPLYGSSETDILHQPEHRVLRPELRTVCQTWMNGNTAAFCRLYKVSPSVVVEMCETDILLESELKKQRSGKLNKDEFTMCQTWKNINTGYFWNSFGISRRSHHLW